MRGTPIYKRNDESLWYYWIDGKQGYASGNIWAITRIGAKRKIHEKHADCAIDAVLHYREYHN